MNKTPSPKTGVPHDELPEPYRLAVRSILEEPVPDFDLARLRPALTTLPALPQNCWARRARVWSLTGGIAACLMMVALAFWPTDVRSQVVQKIRQQPWVRLTLKGDVGKEEKAEIFEIWIAPAKRIGAAHAPVLDLAAIVDLDQQTLQRYDRKTNTIYVSDMMEFDQAEIGYLDILFRSFGEGAVIPQTVADRRLLGQTTTKRGDGVKSWTEHAFEFEDIRRSPSKFQLIFHVSGGAKLPTRMVEEMVVKGKKQTRPFEIDYPATGPADLAALNVPKDAKVVDTRSGKELKSVIEEYAKQQKAPFDPYRAVVLSSVQPWRFLNLDVYRLVLDAAGHSAEAADAEQLLVLLSQIADKTVKVPEGGKAINWWKDEVNKLNFVQYGDKHSFFPGQTFLPDLVGYPHLGLPNDNVRARFESNPSKGPTGTALIEIEDLKAKKVIRRYWLAPDRGMICLRMETTPINAKDWISTTIIDEVEKSPKGHWYATQIRRGAVEFSGDDLRNDIGVAPVATVVTKFLVEFGK